MQPRTCREAVLEAMRRLEERHGGLEFKFADILKETMALGPWEPSTIQTHVNAHMCDGRAGNSLERVAPGVFRRRRDQGWRGDPRPAVSASQAAPGSTIPDVRGLAVDLLVREPTATVASEPSGAPPGIVEGGTAFQERARVILSKKWGVELAERDVSLSGGVTKRFDLVSPNGGIVGDAKAYKNLPSPSAKWSAIAEYVWLLQHTSAERRFLVFGNSDLVPKRWLHRFGPLCTDVGFLFIDGDNVIDLKAERPPRVTG